VISVTGAFILLDRLDNKPTPGYIKGCKGKRHREEIDMQNFEDDGFMQAPTLTEAQARYIERRLAFREMIGRLMAEAPHGVVKRR